MIDLSKPAIREKARELLDNPNTKATTIHSILLSAYGQDLYDEDILEIYARIQNDFRVGLSEENENRINALLLALSTNLFYEDEEAFVSVTNALLYGDIGDLIDGVLDETEVLEVLWASFEVGLNRDDDVEFSPQVQRLIDAVVSEEAEDLDVSEVEVFPYYDKFMFEQKNELANELLSLGVPHKELKGVLI